MNVDLECHGPDEARACVEFLIGKGINDVVQYGKHVHTSITVSSVMRLADDAVDFGWASDSAAAQIIADMSDAVDRANAAGMSIR